MDFFDGDPDVVPRHDCPPGSELPCPGGGQRAEILERGDADWDAAGDDRYVPVLRASGLPPFKVLCDGRTYSARTVGHALQIVGSLLGKGVRS
jgi:hypothetical protein